MGRQKMRRAVFLDRDGTVNRQVGYVNHPSRIRLYPYTTRAIRRLNERGIPVVLVTNQSGVARGLFPESVLQQSHERLVSLLARGGAKLDGIYYCPHHPTAGANPRACRCRKPGTGMLRRASRELDLDSSRSFVVGDSPSDILMGDRAGAKTILTLTGYGRGEMENRRHLWKAEPDAIVRNLEKAVDWILNDMDRNK